jgi:hypothetical protein
MSTPPTETAAAQAAATAPSAAREPIGRRLIRSIVAIALVLALTFLLGVAVVGWVPPARDSVVGALSHDSRGTSTVAALLTAAFILFTPVTIFALAERRRRLTWPLLAFGWVIAIPIFAWLAWDEPAVRRPLTMEEIAPAFDGAEKSYAVLMRYSKQHPSDEAKAFSNFKPVVQWTASGPREPEKWIEYITKNRAGLEADWAKLAPQRAWLAELNGFDRIADLGATSFSADIIRFDVWRTLSQRATAAATLQVLDGHGEEALATILPYLEISRKLEPYSRTLVRTMIARVIQKMSLETITFILNRHTATPAMRARLATALAGGNSPAGARRLVLMEYPYFVSIAREMALGDQLGMSFQNKPPVAGPLNLLSPFLFNPIATTNRYGDYVYELAALAEARELGKFAVRSHGFTTELSRHGGPKNIGGSILLNMATPALDKVLKTYWEIEDLRTALHARVTA